MKKIPKVKLPSLRRRKKVLWELCKQITRKRYAKPDGSWNCYTCDKPIDEPKKAHTGHCINSHFGGLRLRFDLRNLRIQDHYCNINLGSNGAVYVMKLKKEIGDEEVNSMFKLLDIRKEKVDNEREFIEGLIVGYRIILSGLK
jgi:hypothetical protein